MFGLDFMDFVRVLQMMLLLFVVYALVKRFFFRKEKRRTRRMTQRTKDLLKQYEMNDLIE